MIFKAPSKECWIQDKENHEIKHKGRGRRCLRKGGGQQAQKDFVESYVRRKGLVFNHVTNKFTRRSKRYEKEE